jgi:hypothetical protein
MKRPKKQTNRKKSNTQHKIDKNFNRDEFIEDLNEKIRVIETDSIEDYIDFYDSPYLRPPGAKDFTSFVKSEIEDPIKKSEIPVIFEIDELNSLLSEKDWTEKQKKSATRFLPQLELNEGDFYTVEVRLSCEQYMAIVINSERVRNALL